MRVHGAVNHDPRFFLNTQESLRLVGALSKLILLLYSMDISLLGSGLTGNYVFKGGGPFMGIVQMMTPSTMYGASVAVSRFTQSWQTRVWRKVKWGGVPWTWINSFL